MQILQTSIIMPAPPERRVNYTIKREELELFLTKYPNVPLNAVAKQIFLESLKNDEKPKSESNLKPSVTLKDKKTEQETLKIKIDNQLRLMRDLGKTPEQVAQIIKDPDSFVVSDLPDNTKNKKKLSEEQWDYVYGCLIEGYKKLPDNKMRDCIPCGESFYTDEDARNHVIKHHHDKIQLAIKGMGY